MDNAHVAEPFRSILNGFCHYPTRESDGPAYVGTWADPHQAQIELALSRHREELAFARRMRALDNTRRWVWAMGNAASWRQRYAQLVRVRTLSRVKAERDCELAEQEETEQ